MSFKTTMFREIRFVCCNVCIFKTGGPSGLLHILLFISSDALLKNFIKESRDRPKKAWETMGIIKVCRQSRKTFLFLFCFLLFFFIIIKVCRQSRKTFLFLFCFLLFFLLKFFLIFLYHQEHVAISPSFLNRSR